MPYSVPPMVSAGLKPAQVVPGTDAHSEPPVVRLQIFRHRVCALKVVQNVLAEQVASVVHVAPIAPAPGAVQSTMSRSPVPVKKPHFWPVGQPPAALLIGLQFDEHVV